MKFPKNYLNNYLNYICRMIILKKTYHLRYAKCFIDPPYGFRADKMVINQLFLDLNRLLFYNFEYSLIHIYLWDENCSRYFEPGKEWWGAYLWTILIQEKKEIVIIAASSTD